PTRLLLLPAAPVGEPCRWRNPTWPQPLVSTGACGSAAWWRCRRRIELAFVTETAIAEVLQPQALNGGNLVDIYQRREEDFMAKSTMEVWYYDSDGAQVREMMFVMDPNARQVPRVTIGPARGGERHAPGHRRADPEGRLLLQPEGLRGHRHEGPCSWRSSSRGKWQRLIGPSKRRIPGQGDRGAQAEGHVGPERAQVRHLNPQEEPGDPSTGPALPHSQDGRCAAAFYEHVERLLRDRGGRLSAPPSRSNSATPSLFVAHHPDASFTGTTPDSGQPARSAAEA
ncbi:unnamed protein product, partial [Prorocentrum cordatum]